MVVAALAALAFSGAAPAAELATDSATVVVPGAAWSDQNGDLVQLHGIGLLRVGDTYWAYGQDNRDGEPYHCVATYSTKDLATWTRHEDALAFDQHEQLQNEMFDDPKFVVERPKVLYNRRAGRYVMLFHFDTAKRSQSYVGVAVCDRPDGRFSYIGKFRPQGNRSGDMGVFVDPNDGLAYLIAEDRVQAGAPAKARTVIYQLNDDYTDVRPGWSAVLPPVPMRTKYPSVEAPTIVYEPKDKLYYVFGSLLTGWAANDNVYTTTPSLADPKWSPFKQFAPPKSNTYTTQVSFVVPVQGTDATIYIYVADRWLSKHLWDSPPVFLPITIAGGMAKLDWQDAWAIDLKKGTWRAVVPAQTINAGETRNGPVTFCDVRVDRSDVFVLGIDYRNPGPVARFGFDSTRHAKVRVNGGEPVALSFPVTSDPIQPIHRATTRVRLEAGRANTIELSADAGTAPEVDKIVLYETGADAH